MLYSCADDFFGGVLLLGGGGYPIVFVGGHGMDGPVGVDGWLNAGWFYCSLFSLLCPVLFNTVLFLLRVQKGWRCRCNEWRANARFDMGLFLFIPLPLSFGFVLVFWQLGKGGEVYSNLLVYCHKLVTYH